MPTVKSSSSAIKEQQVVLLLKEALSHVSMSTRVTLSGSAGYSFSLPMVAYGNLYALGSGTLYCIGDKATDYPQFHNPSVLNGIPGPNDLNNVAWKYGKIGQITGSAVASNGKIYFGLTKKSTANATTGVSIWNFTTGYRVSSTPAVVNGVVYTGADDGNIYALNANTGQQIWSTPVGGASQTMVYWVSAWQPRSSPQVDNGQVFVGGLSGKLYCLSAASGNILWSSFAGSERNPPGGTPLVTSDTVYIAGSDSNVYAFNRANGVMLWQTFVEGPANFAFRIFIRMVDSNNLSGRQLNRLPDEVFDKYAGV